MTAPLFVFLDWPCGICRYHPSDVDELRDDSSADKKSNKHIFSIIRCSIHQSSIYSYGGETYV